MQQASKGAQAGFTFPRGAREQPSLHRSLDNAVPLTQKTAFLLEATLKPSYLNHLLSYVSCLLHANVGFASCWAERQWGEPKDCGIAGVNLKNPLL